MPSPPQRIASLLASSTEMLYALGMGDRVVAVSHECDFPGEVAAKPRVTRSRVSAALSSRAIDDRVRETFGSGGSLYEIDAERLIELKPDLIVTQAQCDVCAVRYADVVELVATHDALRGTPIVALNPSSLAEILADVRQVGVAAGVSETAERVIAELSGRVEQVRRRAASLPQSDRPRVACIEWIEPLMIAANWIPELAEIAGGRYELAQNGVHSVYNSWQQVLDYDPELLAVMPCGFDLARTREEAPLLRELEGWSDISAAHDGRVHLLDGNAYFNRSGPRMVESLEILAHLIHPQIFDRPRLPEEWGRVCCPMPAAE